jgi:hypothetical protein
MRSFLLSQSITVSVWSGLVCTAEANQYTKSLWG